MNVEPVVRFLHAVENVWRKSGYEEAQSRAEKISNVLKNGNGSSGPISGKWESSMKCDPPKDLTSHLSRSGKR